MRPCSVRSVALFVTLCFLTVCTGDVGPTEAEALHAVCASLIVDDGKPGLPRPVLVGVGRVPDLIDDSHDGFWRRAGDISEVDRDVSRVRDGARVGSTRSDCGRVGGFSENDQIARVRRRDGVPIFTRVAVRRVAVRGAAGASAAIGEWSSRASRQQAGTLARSTPRPVIGARDGS